MALVVTTGRAERERARAEGTLSRPEAAGARVVVDPCWRSIAEPALPPAARAIMTNLGKHAHHGPGLSGRALRFGSLAACAEAAVTGRAPDALPPWLG